MFFFAAVFFGISPEIFLFDISQSQPSTKNLWIYTPRPYGRPCGRVVSFYLLTPLIKVHPPCLFHARTEVHLRTTHKTGQIEVHPEGPKNVQPMVRGAPLFRGGFKIPNMQYIFISPEIFLFDISQSQPLARTWWMYGMEGHEAGLSFFIY